MNAQTPVERAADVHVTGRRIVGTLIDSAVLSALYLLMAIALGTIVDLTGGQSGVPTVVTPSTVLFVLLTLVYYILMEGYRGQTLGKMLVGIRVVDQNSGGMPGPAAAIVRSLLRFVDGLGGYLVALIVVLASPRRQRLGDKAAHTLVVRG
jgi:uncharacterized RDD family membrane protein YckC